ncbi:YcdB/YcdC domain-containing protein [Enterococcus dispar]|jgi:hypothetical protein|uniref:YcdB/YcdC domain-containing protein n=1 Tax=Enterococcus dispar TaxID=44009 RepID=UPI001E4AC697|nr:YcdB/YcdC domain-containing protein [Enterococcus dispar]MCU7356885.1 hypothetical protein [Enterococcus dispar]MDT2704987.1 hypothetical protein [Enterococcus dispar]WCG32548.1 hypothetical protein PML78_10125 [Enterococcus dispar]
MKNTELLNKIVTIPDDYQLAEERHETRNRHKVTILRFQKDGVFEENGPRIIAVFLKDTLVSVKNLAVVPEGKLPSPERARAIAEDIFAKSNRSYARRLSFIRIEHQQREFIGDDKKFISFRFCGLNLVIPMAATIG